MEVDYKEEYNKQCQINLNDVYNEIKNKDSVYSLNRKLFKKFKNQSNKFNLNIDKLFDLAKNNKEICSFFAKDPQRQSLHENYAFKKIKEIEELYDVKQLDSNSPQSKYVVSGMIVNKDQLTGSFENTKSIDFELSFYDDNNKLNYIYVAHKYTNESGGSQDNQLNDVKNFLKNASSNKQTNVYFFAICDGDYYLKKDKSGKTKIDLLNDEFFSKKTKILKLENLPEAINILKNINNFKIQNNI